MAYSYDFRLKIFEVWLKKEGYVATLAQRLSVSKGFIDALIALYHETGDVKKRPRGGGNPDKLAQVGGYKKLRE